MVYVAAYLGLVVVMSGVTFLAYGWDKRQAGLHRRRVSERTLHGMALLGGFPGAWFAQRRFRHKTQKWRFLMVFWLTIFIHLAVVIGVFWMLFVGDA